MLDSLRPGMDSQTCNGAAPIREDRQRSRALLVQYTSPVVNLVRKLLQAYGRLGFAVQAAIVIGIVVATTGIAIAMVVSIPADHFRSGRPKPASWWRGHTVLRALAFVLKNALGFVLLALGVVMAMPLVPGPGLVFILLGLSLLDFPGKRKAERRLLAVPSVIRFLNEVRARFGREPLVVDVPAAGRERAGIDENR
jgi:hypothetical protein